MREYKHAVFIGRFQPFHNGHMEVVRNGLEIADNLIIVVGSANAAPNIKNPWSFEERKTMIEAAIAANAETAVRYREADRVHVVGVRDYYYNENAWITDVQAKTDQFIQPGDSVALLGNYKDASSYYLNHFPQWEFVPTSSSTLHATDIRERLFRESFHQDWQGKVPEARRTEIVALANGMPCPSVVKQYLSDFVQTERYPALCAEWEFIRGYKDSWLTAPFPPTFVTTDAIVVCSGHVLVVKRKFNPGKGLFALPGGFLRQGEKIQDGMLRELKEETGIRVERIILESSIVASKVFDHPDRSLRGRTISHGFYLKLKDGRLPEVRANDDASEALWMPLMDVLKNEDKFFEDHAHIINHFVNYS